MICSPSPKMLSFAVLCWDIQAKWESQVTDLLGEPQVRSSSDMRQQWISGTEQSITPRQRQASGGGMNFPLETPPVQRQLHILMREQVPGFYAASTAVSGTFGKGRKRGTRRRAQEEGTVGSKKKSNSLQRYKNLKKSIQRFRKKRRGLPRGQLLRGMTRCPTTTGRAYDRAKVCGYLHTRMKEETCWVQNCCNKMRKAFLAYSGLKQTWNKGSLCCQNERFAEEEKRPAFIFTGFIFHYQILKSKQANKQTNKTQIPPGCSTFIGTPRYVLAESKCTYKTFF